MILKKLCGRFCDQDMDTSTNGVFGNACMGCVRCKNSDGISRGKSIDGSLIGIGISSCRVGGKRGEGDIKTVVCG